MATRNIYRPILRVVIFILALAEPIASPAKAQAVATISQQAQQVIEFMRDRKHAYERVDPSAWGMHVAEQCSFIQSGGRVFSKAEFMTGMVPFVGYKFSAVVSDVRAAEFGDPIILTYREKEIRDYGVQRSENT